MMTVTIKFQKETYPQESTSHRLKWKSLIETSIYLNQTGDIENTFTNRLTKRIITIIPTTIMSYLAAFVLRNIGVFTTLHEYVGHGLLGLKLTHIFPKGIGPTYQVDGFDNFKRLLHSKSFLSAIKIYFQWLIGYDYNHDKVKGVTIHRLHNLNQLGLFLGKESTSAWVSFLGAVPELIIDTTLVLSGMQLRNKYSAKSIFLLGFGVFGHVYNSLYPLSSAIKSNNYLSQNNNTKHDFDNFARIIAKNIGYQPKTIAGTTGTLWMLSVPLFAFMMLLYQNSHQTDIVPDYLALKEWIKKIETNKKYKNIFEILLNSYPHKKKLLKYWKQDTRRKKKNANNVSYSELRLFIEYLAENLSSKILQKEKRNLLKKWEPYQVPTTTEKFFSLGSLVASVTAVSSRVLQLFGKTLAPVLKPVSNVLTGATVFFSGIGILSSGYRVVKDFKSSSQNISGVAKIISFAHLIFECIKSTAITTGLTNQSFNGFLPLSVVVGAFGSLTLSFTRQKLIKKRFNLIQSLKPQTWLYMYDVLKLYKKKNKLESLKKEKKLKSWILKQKQAYRLHLLSQRQIALLQKFHLLFKDDKDIELTSLIVQ